MQKRGGAPDANAKLWRAKGRARGESRYLPCRTHVAGEGLSLRRENPFEFPGYTLRRKGYGGCFHHGALGLSNGGHAEFKQTATHAEAWRRAGCECETMARKGKGAGESRYLPCRTHAAGEGLSLRRENPFEFPGYVLVAPGELPSGLYYTLRRKGYGGCFHRGALGYGEFRSAVLFCRKIGVFPDGKAERGALKDSYAAGIYP